MTLSKLRLFLLAPLAAFFLTTATPASAKDGRAARADRIEDRIDRRHDHGRLDRIEDRIDWRTGPGRYYNRPQRAHRSYLRNQRKVYRKHRRAHRFYKRQRNLRRPYLYRRW